jgi:hypothetical protein
MPFMCKKRKRIQTYTQRSASLNPVENSKSGIQTKMTQWVKMQCIFAIINRISPMERLVILKNLMTDDRRLLNAEFRIRKTRNTISFS